MNSVLIASVKPRDPRLARQQQIRQQQQQQQQQHIQHQLQLQQSQQQVPQANFNQNQFNNSQNSVNVDNLDINSASNIYNKQSSGRIGRRIANGSPNKISPKSTRTLQGKSSIPGKAKIMSARIPKISSLSENKEKNVKRTEYKRDDKKKSRSNRSPSPSRNHSKSPRSSGENSSSKARSSSSPNSSKFKDLKGAAKGRNYVRRNRNDSKSPTPASKDANKDVDLRQLLEIADNSTDVDKNKMNNQSKNFKLFDEVVHILIKSCLTLILSELKMNKFNLFFLVVDLLGKIKKKIKKRIVFCIFVLGWGTILNVLINKFLEGVYFIDFFSKIVESFFQKKLFAHFEVFFLLVFSYVFSGVWIILFVL